MFGFETQLTEPKSLLRLVTIGIRAQYLHLHCTWARRLKWYTGMQFPLRNTANGCHGSTLRTVSPIGGGAVNSASATPPCSAVLADDFTVACGAGALRLTRVQGAGRAATDGAAFLRGARVAVGSALA